MKTVYCCNIAQRIEFHRMEFCELFLVRSQEDENFQGCVNWTDEAKFGFHNSNLWSDQNPHIFLVVHFQG